MRQLGTIQSHLLELCSPSFRLYYLLVQIRNDSSCTRCLRAGWLSLCPAVPPRLILAGWRIFSRLLEPWHPHCFLFICMKDLSHGRRELDGETAGGEGDVYKEELINKRKAQLFVLIALLSLIVWIFVDVRRICAFSLVMQTFFSPYKFSLWLFYFRLVSFSCIDWVIFTACFQSVFVHNSSSIGKGW